MEVKQKVIADIMEALTGAAFMVNFNFEEAVRFLTCCGVLPPTQPARFDEPCRGFRRPRLEMLRCVYFAYMQYNPPFIIEWQSSLSNPENTVN